MIRIVSKQCNRISRKFYNLRDESFTRDSNIWFSSCRSSSNKEEEELRNKEEDCTRRLLVDCLSTILMLVDNLMVVGFLRTCYSWSLSLSLFSITKIPKRSLCAYIYISISIKKKRTLVKTKKTTIINNENNDNAIDVDIFITSSISFFKKDRVRKVSTINNVNIDEFVNKS